MSSFFLSFFFLFWFLLSLRIFSATSYLSAGKTSTPAQVMNSSPFFLRGFLCDSKHTPFALFFSFFFLFFFFFFSLIWLSAQYAFSSLGRPRVPRMWWINLPQWLSPWQQRCAAYHALQWGLDEGEDKGNREEEKDDDFEQEPIFFIFLHSLYPKSKDVLHIMHSTEVCVLEKKVMIRENVVMTMITRRRKKLRTEFSSAGSIWRASRDVLNSWTDTFLPRFCVVSFPVIPVPPPAWHVCSFILSCLFDPAFSSSCVVFVFLSLVLSLWSCFFSFFV